MNHETSIKDLQIRLATKSDIEAMLGLLKQLFVLETDFQFDAAKQRSGLEQLIQYSEADEARAAVFVVTVKEKVIAMCSCQVFISTAEGGKSGLIEDVVVYADYRQQGVGQQLMQHVIKWADTQGLKRLQLLADKNNEAAITFYKTQGWQSTQLSALFKLL